ncbi:MAG: DUF262 domain-containing protein [Polyangiales bacterium]
MTVTVQESGVDAAARCVAKVERGVGQEAPRREVLTFLARCIEIADEERADGWYVRETGNGLALVTGRLEAFRTRKDRIDFSVIGPISPELRAELGAEERDNEEWRAIAGGLLLAVPASKAGHAQEKLEEGFRRFVEAAMGRMRRAVTQEQHLRGVVEYVGRAVGRELPQPTEAPSLPEGGEPTEGSTEGEVNSAPVVRGRPPIFDTANVAINSLLGTIEAGTMALPDLQRPFVWRDTEVRDLLDSLFVGFPVGTLVLWNSATAKEARGVGGFDRLKVTTLIIDGQQRLTSLYAVMRGVPVTDRDGTQRQITIAFRPRDGRFEVADAAIRNDPEFIPDLRVMWSNQRTKGQLRRELLGGLRDRGRVVDDAYENAVEENLDRVQGIADYKFPVVTIKAADEASEEDVAEIFVRINNQGKRLGQADFVLTLLSVFHGELRDRIEKRAREMSEDSVVEVDTQGLLRATVAVGFHRAKMSAVYRFLRGVDPRSGDTSPDARVARLKKLDEAAAECLEPTNWRDYLLRVVHAGFVHPSLIASNNAIVYGYALYVLGKRVGVAKPQLDALISRWVFATLLSARYSGSSETVFEQDLARVAELADGDADGFVSALDRALKEVLTGDFWTTRLVVDLETQRSHAPSALAFRAAQVILGARGLFSDQSLRNLLDPYGRGARAASEQHHLFPQAWLASKQIRDRKRVNQVANLADVGWYENAVIGARSPARYVPEVRARLAIDDELWGRACAEHALPPTWETMDYDVFLAERRRRMADLIRVAYRKLGGEQDAEPLAPPWFLPGAEHVWQRIAETERALRGFVRSVYETVYRERAVVKVREALSSKEQETLDRAMRSRPAGADPMSVLDYFYLGQLPTLLFVGEAWQEARQRFGGVDNPKAKLQEAIQDIAPVRNEIAHVREVSAVQLQRAMVACADVIALIRPPAR